MSCKEFIYTHHPRLSIWTWLWLLQFPATPSELVKWEETGLTVGGTHSGHVTDTEVCLTVSENGSTTRYVESKELQM